MRLMTDNRKELAAIQEEVSDEESSDEPDNPLPASPLPYVPSHHSQSPLERQTWYKLTMS